MERSTSLNPGPTNALRLVVPQVPAGASTKAAGLSQFRPWPPTTPPLRKPEYGLTPGTRLARWLPSSVPEVSCELYTENGAPLRKVSRLFNCQPLVKAGITCDPGTSQVISPVKMLRMSKSLGP